MTQPTHAIIDGQICRVASIDRAVNSAHSHRVTFACGMTFDVRGAHQFKEHAAQVSDVVGRAASGMDEKKRADDAAGQIDAVHAKLYEERARLAAHVEEIRLGMEGLGVAATTEDVTAMVAAGKVGTPEIQMLFTGIEGAETIVRDAEMIHAEACAMYHDARRHDKDRRWITSTTDVTTHDACLASSRKGA